MNIDTLEAGRELDALVAERVMGWTIKCEQVQDIRELGRSARTVTLYTVKDGNGTKWSPCRSLDSVGLPNYSTDIAAAWQVVEKMLCSEANISFHFTRALCLGGPVTDLEGGNYLRHWSGDDVIFYVLNALRLLIPLNICRAALKAVME